MRIIPATCLFIALAVGCTRLAVGQSVDYAYTPAVSAEAGSELTEASANSGAAADALSITGSSAARGAGLFTPESPASAPATGSNTAHVGQPMKTSSKAAGGSPSARPGVAASAAPHSAATSGVAQQQPGMHNALAGMAAGQRSRSLKSKEETPTMGEEESSAGSYTNDFPDSTKGKGLISPPDPALHPPFSFDTTVSMEFADFSSREFLAPTLHVGGGSSSSANAKQDIYQRIEERLRSYQTGEKRRKHEKGAVAKGKAPGSERTEGSAGLAKESATSRF